MSKVVHLSNDAHAVAKVYCKARGLKMSDWVGALILEAIEAEAKPKQTEPVPDSSAPRKKTLPRLGDEAQASVDGLPVYTQPPFWSRVEKAQENTLEEPEG